jgi:hypothetical protein
MIERARREKLPVIASNYPSKLRNRESMTPDERALVPVELRANTEEYWRRVDNAIRGHAAMMGPAASTPDERLKSMQSLWDNSMGESCARAHRASSRSHGVARQRRISTASTGTAPCVN